MTLKRNHALSGLLLVALFTGCDKKDQDAALDQSRAVVAKAADFASGAWRSAVEKANKLSANSGTPAIEAAKSQLEAVQKKMTQIKAPSSLDDLKLDSVKDQIERLEAALNVKKLKAEMDARVDDAMKAKDNAQKSIHDVRDKLAQADAEYQDLQKKLHDAQAVYDSASDKVKQTTDKLQSL